MDSDLAEAAKGLEIDASMCRMVSTPGAKYAHAMPDMAGKSRWWGDTACGRRLKQYDSTDITHDRYAEGKPPCPKCIRAIDWHLTWTKAWVDSYRNMTNITNPVLEYS